MAIVNKETNNRPTESNHVVSGILETSKKSRTLATIKAFALVAAVTLPTLFSRSTALAYLPSDAPAMSPREVAAAPVVSKPIQAEPTQKAQKILATENIDVWSIENVQQNGAILTYIDLNGVRVDQDQPLYDVTGEIPGYPTIRVLPDGTGVGLFNFSNNLLSKFDSGGWRSVNPPPPWQSK